jgi:hypothetical protein
MTQCVKYPTLEGKLTILPGNFETYLSDKGRNLWMEFVRPRTEWNTWRRAEQKMYAIQLRQNGINVDLTEEFMTREYWFRKAEEAMFDTAKTWVAAGPVVDA